MKTHKTSPVKYWSGVPLTENDIIGWAESTGFGSEGAMPHKSRRVSDAIAHLQKLGHKITQIAETVAKPSNDRADLPPTEARQPRSGTEGAIGG